MPAFIAIVENHLSDLPLTNVPSRLQKTQQALKNQPVAHNEG